MGVAASAVQQQQGGPSGPGGSEAATGGGGAWGAGERNASSSVRYPTEASPHEPSLGGATATTASLASSLAPGSHASLGQRASGGWSHVRMSGGSHAGAGARPASDDGGATSVSVKIMPLVQGKGEVRSFKVTSTGGVLQGGMAPEVRDIAREYEKLTGQSLPRFHVEDRRAQQLLITQVGEDYFVTPSPELFSRHTGTCRVLGDKHQRAADHPLQVGDYLRIGSVGLVVSEMHAGGGPGGGPVAIAERDLFYLREDAGELKEDLFAQEEAATAAEERAGRASPGKSPRVAQCYMCFDDEDSTTNPLVAPCLCKGGTRYVHLTCLQRWQAAAGDDKECVATSAERKNACKVCKSRYKTHVRASDGRLLPLMVHQLPPPFICFLVVTKHETAEELFNTQFQLSFAENKQIVIGRSRNCNMVLDYRTVSTQHATVTFRKGQFLFRDLSSSNGSMLNLRQPLRLPYNQWVRLRCGRSIVALKAKRSWVRRKLSSMSSTLAGAAAAATGGAFASSAASSQQPGQHHGSRESLGAGMGAGPRMSVSQHLNLELLLQQQQQQQQQQAATQRGRPPHPQQAGGGGGVVDSSSSVNSAASAGSDASGGGAIGTASTASPAVGPTAKGAGGGDEQQVELLESLCRIEATPRPHSGLGASGLLTPGGGRFYQSIAGESMSPSAVSAALFELHLQVGASSRRVFEGIDADGAAADAAGAADESAYADAEEGERSQNHHHQQQHKSRPASLVGVQAMKLDGLVGEGTEGQQQQQPPPVTAAAPPPARQIFHGVHFIPQDSPENSPLSEVGR